MNNNPSAKKIQQAFYNQNSKYYDFIIPNAFIDWQFKEMDILALKKSGFVDEFEIKRSFSDFKADYKKTVYVNEGVFIGNTNKHEALVNGFNHCNRFSFIVTEDILDKVVEFGINEKYGLYKVRYIERTNTHSITCIKAADLLHRRKLSEDLKYQLGRKMAYRYWNLINENE